jgi:hypothetical protein
MKTRRSFCAEPAELRSVGVILDDILAPLIQDADFAVIPRSVEA